VQDAKATNGADQDLMEFFVSAYHLRDALFKDHVAGRDQVEQAISDSPTLSLLADTSLHLRGNRLERRAAARLVDVPVLSAYKG